MNSERIWRRVIVVTIMIDWYQITNAKSFKLHTIYLKVRKLYKFRADHFKYKKSPFPLFLSTTPVNMVQTQLKVKISSACI